MRSVNVRLMGLGCSSPRQRRRPRLIVTSEVIGMRDRATSCWASVLRAPSSTVEVVVADAHAAPGRQHARRRRQRQRAGLAGTPVGVAEAPDRLLDGLSAEALLQPRGDLVDAAVRGGVAQVVTEAVQPAE